MSGSSDDQDATSHYEVTKPPTGGPGRWPAEMPTGETRSIFEQLVRETEEPTSRVVLRVVTVVVVIVIVVAGTIAWDDLDSDIARNDARIAQLEREIARLQADSAGG